MPRPLPLKESTSARASLAEHQNQVLTPRTPHSKSGRAEEGWREEETHDAGQYAQYQSVPLLRSSASDSFPRTPGYRSQGDDHDGPAQNERQWSRGKPLSLELIISRLPLVMGSIFALFLLFLTVVSYKRPDKLHYYFGVGRNGTQVDAATANTHHRNATLPAHIISYENYTHFPLRPTEYRAECAKKMSGYMSHGGYWDTPAMGSADVLHVDEQEDYSEKAGEKAICSKTLTYMLDGTVGLFADLALLAQAAAVARERNRTLLIDDTYWDRGRWTDYFLDIRLTQPGPEPDCTPPPPNELVACPRLARHWIVNSRTAKYHFGHGYSENYEDAYAHNLNRLKPLFNNAEYSFEHTIKPNSHVSSLIQAARQELDERILGGGDGRSSYTALHIRRGDREPAFYRAGPYLPTGKYTQAAGDAWHRLHPDESGEGPFLYVASDSPGAINEVQEIVEDQEATLSLEDMRSSNLRTLASPKEYIQADFDTLDQPTRGRATAGVIVDFALLSGMWSVADDLHPEAVVCSISSNICKLAAVGLGWDRAFGDVDSMGYLDDKHKGWIEIDQNGVVVPVWEAFELF